MKLLSSFLITLLIGWHHLSAQEVFEVKKPATSFIPASAYGVQVQVTTAGRPDTALAAAIQRQLVFPDSFKVYELQAVDIVSFEIGSGGTGNISRFGHQYPLLYGLDSLSGKAIVAGVKQWQAGKAAAKADMLSLRYRVVISYVITDTLTHSYWRNTASRNDNVVRITQQLRTGAIKYWQTDYDDPGLAYNLALNYLYDESLRNYCTYLKQHMAYLKLMSGASFTNNEIAGYLLDCKAAEQNRN